ncbi:MAG: ferredoxin--NADP reductase [Terriglobales bacterium]
MTAPMPVRRVFGTSLLERESPCEGTVAFRFAKPAGFAFRPGQYVDIGLIHPPTMDTQGATRTFSIASAPYEPDLLVATRMGRSAFKRILAQAPAGTEARLEGPSGSFTLHKNTAKPAVFLAGGIGITPFRSIIRQAAHDHLGQSLYLFYGNSRLGRAAFLPELEELATSCPQFHLVAVMADPAGGWRGPVGRLAPALIAGHLASLQGPIYYIAGPPEMVGGVRQSLLAAGIDEDDIRAEEFGGY